MPATAVEISNYTWTHAGRAQPAVDKLNLRIPAGERVLICGDSGSGKSTLVSGIGAVLGGSVMIPEPGGLRAQ